MRKLLFLAPGVVFAAVMIILAWMTIHNCYQMDMGPGTLSLRPGAQCEATTSPRSNPALPARPSVTAPDPSASSPPPSA